LLGFDFILVFVDPGESPPTHRIRAQGGEAKMYCLSRHIYFRRRITYDIT
jgi:hypothetical protein